MKLIEVFTKQSPNRVFISLVFGVLGGLGYPLLIPLILAVIGVDANGIVFENVSDQSFLSFEVKNYKAGVVFLALCVFILVAKTISQTLLSLVSIELISNIRIKLYKAVLSSPIDVLDNLGTSKLMAIFSLDVYRIVNGAKQVPDLFISAITTLGLLVYLLFLNSKVCYLVLFTILVGITVYQLPILISNRFFNHSRSKFNDLHESIKGLVFGIKELKLNEKKSDMFFDDSLLNNEHQVKRGDKFGSSIMHVATNVGEMIGFFVIGIVIFIFINYESLTNEELLAVVMVLLYVSGPISSMINSLPQIFLSQISLRNVNEILSEIRPEKINNDVKSIPSWDKIKFRAVEYKYPKRSYQIGPIDCEIYKSEITFIIGGNGSGKSTLSKLISLHHQPSSGTIEFGCTVINSDNLKCARQYVSSIYSDYYLFERLFGIDLSLKQHEIAHYLKELDLHEKVKIDEGVFSTLDLSDGQKRRLALLVALLEDKELYLFDEWAADQDPKFKETFYYQILPMLKSKGKTVVVISHDDRYFHLADQILTMENGQLKSSYHNTQKVLINS